MNRLNPASVLNSVLLFWEYQQVPNSTNVLIGTPFLIVPTGTTPFKGVLVGTSRTISDCSRYPKVWGMRPGHFPECQKKAAVLIARAGQ